MSVPAPILPIDCHGTMPANRSQHGMGSLILIHEEKFRFQYLVDSLKKNEEEDSTSIEYKAAGLSLINAIVNSPDVIEERILLRDEFERRGIDMVFKVNFILRI